MSELESGFRVADALGVLRRQWVVVVVAAAVGAVLGYLLFTGAPTRYEATARVEVKAITGVNDVAPTRGSNTSGVDIPTEQDLVQSDAVATAARATLRRGGTNRALLSHVSVATELDSNVLKITFEDDTSAGASAGANATAAAYIDQRAASAKATVDRRIKAKSEQLKGAQADLTAANVALGRAKDGSAEQNAAKSSVQSATTQVNTLNQAISDLGAIDTQDIGSVIRKAPPSPPAITSKKAVGKGVGVFGLCALAGLALAWFLDRRDALEGGRRRIEALLPGSTSRILPGSDGRGTAAELDAAIDRLAVDIAAGSAKGRAASVLLAGSGAEPPISLAQELASSLSFAGIPALFVVAGSTDRILSNAQVVRSFADLLTSPSVTGPGALPAIAGADGSSSPLVAWLRPRGSAEASGLLRRAVVEALVTRAGRERYEVVVFVAPSPTRTAAAAALGQWVDRTVLVVGDEERPQAEPSALALSEADVRVSEVVWT